MSPVVACPNCDGRLCMSCVLRQIHDECVDDCPFCCAPMDPDAELAWAVDTGNAAFVARLIEERDEARAIADYWARAVDAGFFEGARMRWQQRSWKDMS